MLFNNFAHLGNLTTTSATDRVCGVDLSRHIAVRAAEFKGIVGPHDRVLICHGGSAGFVIDLLAVWSLGAAAACVNPTITDNEKKTLTDFLKPRLILNSPDTSPVYTTENPQGARSDAPSLDDPALYLFTSGTTGNPKGVEHTFRSLLCRIALNQAYIGTDCLQKALCPLPTHFGHGLIGNLLTPLLNGSDVVLLDDKSPAGLAKLGQIIDEFDIRFLSSVPSFWKLVTRFSKPPANGTLKRVHVGSAPLSTDLWQAIAEWAGTRQVFNMYGITETANWIGGTSLDQSKQQDGQIGEVWGGSALVKNSKTGKISATGTGELLIQSPSLMTGYYQQPDLTAQVLKDGWFHTGDIGVIDKEGSIQITGRQKSEINRAGIKISPEEIDLLLERHPDIQEVCVFGLPDPISGESVAAACVLKEQTERTPKDLRNWLKGYIRREAIPEHWFFLAEIPKTDRGKINRNIVRDVCLEVSKSK